MKPKTAEERVNIISSPYGGYDFSVDGEPLEMNYDDHADAAETANQIFTMINITVEMCCAAVMQYLKDDTDVHARHAVNLTIAIRKAMGVKE